MSLIFHLPKHFNVMGVLFNEAYPSFYVLNRYCVWERERVSVCENVREIYCVSVCVRESECVWEWERECVYVWVCVRMGVYERERK